jgi:hypothetical protein
VEQSLKHPASLKLSQWREKVKTFSGNIFSPPYLPARFAWIFLLTYLTLLAVNFMNYSPQYWRKDFRIMGIAPSDVAHEVSLTNWLVFSVVALPIAVFCLVVFNYRWSLIGWIAAQVLHFWAIATWLDGCSYGRWSISTGKLCESFDERLYWIIVAVLLGVAVSTYLHPGADSIPRYQLKKKVPRAFVFLSAAWIFLLFLGTVSSAQKPTSGWIPLELDVSPPPLQGAVHAYDTKHKKLILFGGITDYVDGHAIYKNETWEWDGRQWRNVSLPPQNSPRSRTSAGMAYDENRDVIVLYGGAGSSSPLCDTWEWNGSTWTFLCPPTCPGARYAHEMFYDPVRKKVVLYGGYDNKTFFNDAWEWDGYTWTKIELEGDSPMAATYALAYDPDENFAFGLLSGIGGTWTFRDNHWTRLSTIMEPGNRGGMRLVYEPERKVFVTFGGFSNTLTLNDTWLFDANNWSPFLGAKFQPPVRSGMVMWYDRVRGHVMLFGGGKGALIYGDTWELIFPEK